MLIGKNFIDLLFKFLGRQTQPADKIFVNHKKSSPVESVPLPRQRPTCTLPSVFHSWFIKNFLPSTHTADRYFNSLLFRNPENTVPSV